MAIMETGIGAPVLRKEDERFLTGYACFSDDIKPDGVLAALALRSPVAHAEIRTINVEAARTAAGVKLVLLASDLEAEGVQVIPSYSTSPPFDVGRIEGGDAADLSQYPLARDRVRYAGEPVAFVVADTIEEARTAAELIEVDYVDLPAVMEIEEALAPSSEQLWFDAPGNVTFDWETGDAAATDAVFATAAHVSCLRVENNRVVIAFMEPRAAVAEWDQVVDRYTLQVGCQSAHGMRAGLATVLGVDEGKIHVVVPDTGGGFGARGGVYPEFVLALLSARLLGRPVKWTESRSEAFLTDTQSRDHVLHGELALDGDGHFLALRVRGDWRHGAYLGSRSIWVMTHYLTQILGGPYRIPTGHLILRGIATNTTPVGALRGIGRLEANYVLERLIDQAASEFGADPVTLRRKNLIGSDDFPWRTIGGATVTSGEYLDNLDHALMLANPRGIAARRARASTKGWLHGFGVALYTENNGSTPTEFAEIAVDGAGKVTATVGTQDFGMGHSTMYSQILSQWLGVSFADVLVVFGDTDKVYRGVGSFGSRSARLGGSAAVLGAEKVIKRGRAIASDLLEAASMDIEFANGRFTIAGTDRNVGLSEVAARAEVLGNPLSERADFVAEGEVVSNGVHVCEVSIDPVLGTVRLDNYVIVADVGRVVNPVIVAGQMHGGAAQGIGQALQERIAYDRNSGQTLTGSFMDYNVPKADDLPVFQVAFNEVIEAENPLGVKGAGECATTGAPAAVMNAVADALRRAGAQPVDMPATPESVWRALRAAG